MDIHNNNILLCLAPFEKPYIPALRGIFPQSDKVTVRLDFSSLAAVTVAAMGAKATKVITTDVALLKALVEKEGWTGEGERPSIDNYQGSIFHYSGLEILICPPIKQLVTVNEGKFIFKRFISKLLAPETWFKQTTFTWELATESTIEQLYSRFTTAKYIAIDIETNRWVNAIDMVSYCGIWYDPVKKEYETHAIVLDITDMFWVSWMRKFNQLPAEKIFQNGKYDVTYFFLYNAVPTNWLWDTIDLFHSWYSELPKSLDFQSAFCVRDFKYWKHEASGGKEARLQYNAKDTWVTAMAFLAEISEMPDWALRNYVIEFPLIPACLYCELQGIKADEQKLLEVKEKCEQSAQQLLVQLQKMVGEPQFNPRSPVQVKKLMQILGHKDIEDTNEATLKAAAFKDPLTGIIVDKILEYRGEAKLVSTYLVPEKLYKGRIMYALNPFATDTGRLASREHQLSYVSYDKKKDGEVRNVGLQIQNIPREEVRNVGLQIQNIPREGNTVKSYFKSDDGFLWFEADYAQAEARDTAYLSGDEALIAAVDGERDFHSINASAFFGIPYEQITNSSGKTINKPIRDLAKRVNHGSNYNMGAKVLVQTMGLNNIFKARKLLNLPANWTAIKVAEYLLGRYEATYPVVKGAWYRKVISDILLTKLLIGPTGWTRHCFGKPDKSKPDLNAYVAHPPQSLNAQTLNIAFKKVFYQLLPEHHENLRIKAQIHDSILGQYRIGHEYLLDLVKDAMVLPITVVDSFGISRQLTVPVDINSGKQYWSELK